MSQNNKIRIGVVGAGHIAQVVHIPLWKKIPEAHLASVCDTSKAKAQWVAEKFNVPHFCADADELFKSDEIDAIDICTETHTHKDLAIAALSAGKHVLVEKPMATTYADAKAMAAAAEKYDRQLMVAMNVRFRRDAITLKSFVDGNELGDVFYARCGWLLRRNLASAGSNWLYSKATSGGGVLMDLGSQMLDVSWWLLGNRDPVSVKAVSFHRAAGLEVEDSASVLVHFEGNVALLLEVSWTILSERDILYANFYGTEATAQINPLRVFKNMHGNLINIIPSRDEGNTLRYKRSYKNELRHFLACLTKKMPLQAGGAEIAERLRLLEAIYKSAETGREVVLKKS